MDRAVAMQLAHDRGEDSATVGDVVLPRIAPAASASAPRRPAMVLVISGRRVIRPLYFVLKRAGQLILLHFRFCRRAQRSERAAVSVSRI